jgi:glucans biosynthesis protein
MARLEHLRFLECGIAIAVFALTVLAEPAYAQEASQTQFSKAVVEEIAKSLATKAYVPPPETLPQGVDNLDYDQYRQIRFRKERTIWRGEGSIFQLQVLPGGWLFKTPVEINLVEGGTGRLLAPDQSYFDLGPLAGKLAPEERLGFSGFRITSPMNRPDVFDEVIVFQGASYFRALSRNQVYGLSARGLAVNVGGSGGEEFPAFRKFWIEKPAPGAATLTIHALLDSPSVTGAYLLRVTPGSPTVTEVEATLIPRKELANVGVAPLTSMFLFSDINRQRISDFRPAVHDSDGLAVVNGWGENLWRPLSNPKRLQTSSFLDNNPRGYGLIQRTRSFSEFQDLEAGYEKRPSAWIEPLQPWGSGAVELFEIPTEEEIHDNIVAYWKPSLPLKAGHAHNFNYRLTWPNDAPRRWPGAFVHATRSGLVNGPQRSTGAIQYAVDFKGYSPATSSELPQAKLEVSAGSVSPPVVQANPHIDGIRVSFSFDPKGVAASELRLVLQVNDKAVSETWLHRWTKG